MILYQMDDPALDLIRQHVDAIRALLGRPVPDAWWRGLAAGDRVKTVTAAKLYREPGGLTYPIRDVGAGQLMDVYASRVYGGATWYPGKPDTVCVYSGARGEFWVPGHALVKV